VSPTSLCDICLWLTISCSDIDKGMEYFYEQCVIAGPLECALYEKTPSAVHARVEKIFATMLRRPIPTVIGTGPLDYGLVDYGTVRRTVLKFLYIPFSFGGQALALLLASAEKGDGSPFYQTQLDQGTLLQCACDNGPTKIGGLGPVGAAAIAFSDSGPINDTVAELEAWYEANKRESSFADVRTERVIGACVDLCHFKECLLIRFIEDGRSVRQRSSMVCTLSGSLRFATLCSHHRRFSDRREHELPASFHW
jgi:hypothetical protein